MKESQQLKKYRKNERDGAEKPIPSKATDNSPAT
jgi:hypothetical protein